MRARLAIDALLGYTIVIMEPLDPKKGDEIEISIAGKREFKIPRDRSKEKALEAIRRLARPLPPGFRFDREEANER